MSENVFSNAKAYEGYVGRWSRFVAKEFIGWLGVGTNQIWFDLGAGTGILTQTILEEASPTKVIAVDFSQDYIDFARQRVQDKRVEFRVEDATNVAYETPQFDVAVAGLVLNFLPAPQQAINSMTQAVKAGGTVGAYVWDYSGRMEMMRHFWDAAIVVDASAKEMDAGQRFAICHPDNLREGFQTAGLTAVEVIPIDIQTRFKDFDDYWLPFLGAQGSVSKYLRGLDDTMKNAVRDQLQKQLPITDDGSISLIARAWAAKGKR